METLKLPSYLKIENPNKIHYSAFRIKGTFEAVFALVLFPAMGYYLYTIRHIFEEDIMGWVPFAVFVLALISLGGLLHQIFSKTTIELEPEQVSIKKRWIFYKTENNLRLDVIASIAAEAHEIKVDKPGGLAGMFVSKKPEYMHHLYTYLKNGEKVDMLSGFDDLSTAIHLRDFIMRYYGLDEKAKM